jgi:hypothetical protein
VLDLEAAFARSPNAGERLALHARSPRRHLLIPSPDPLGASERRIEYWRRIPGALYKSFVCIKLNCDFKSL